MDYNEDKNYIVTTELINFEKGDIKSDIFSVIGETFFDGVRNLINLSGRKLYWAHSKVIVISEQIAKDGLIQVLDLVYRDAELRTDMIVLISSEISAKEILEAEAEKINILKAFHSKDIIESGGDVSTYNGVPLWRVVKDINSDDISPLLPIVFISSHGEVDSIEIGGMAVFKKDKMVGYLNQDESKIAFLIKNQLDGGVFVMPIPENHEVNSITFEMFENKSKFKSMLQENIPKITIDVELAVGIAEIDGIINFKEKESREEIISKAEKMLASEIEDLILKVKNEYKSDVLGFLKVIKDKYPSYWKENDKDEILASLEYDVNVEIVIRGSALFYKPLEIAN